jgi:capsular exopolysaccharide synthesis family protein
MTIERLNRSLHSGPDGGLAGSSFDLWHYLAILRRKWWLILSTTVIAFGMTWWSQRNDLPEYTAEALLQQLPDEAATSPWGSFYGADMGSHLDIIRSAKVLSPVVDSLGLQLRLKNYQDQRTVMIRDFEAERAVRGSSYRLEVEGERLVLTTARGRQVIAEGSIGSPLEGPGFTLVVNDIGGVEDPVVFSVSNSDIVLEALERGLRIEQGAGADLIWIRYRSADAQHAARLVNAVAASYQRHRARSARETAGRRRQFIADQLNSMADSLRTAQQGVIDYLAFTLYDPNTENSAVVSELLAGDAALRELRYQESVLSGLVAGLQTSGDNDQALRQVMALGSDLVPQGPALSRQLQDLQLRRAELTASRFGLTAADPQVQVVDSLIVETKAQAKLAAEQSLRSLRDRINLEQGRYNQLRGQAGSLPVRTAEHGRLEQRVNAVQGVFDQLVARYFEAQITEGVEVGDIDIVAPAAVPVWPDRSFETMNLGVGLMAGLLVGLIGALLADQFDSRVRRSTDVERATNLDVVGTIPSIGSVSGSSASAQISKDAFRNLRTHLRFAGADESPRTVAVTSATPRDGKSTVAANLAMTLADQGGRTLLMDADLRRPQIHTTFGIEQGPGLADILLGHVSSEDAAQATAEIPALRILTCGTRVENPAELIGSTVFDECILELRRMYDYIVIDTPPLMAVTDAALVGAVADGTLIVVRANKTDTDALSAAVNQLRRLRVPLLGVVMNGVPTGRSSGYSYYPSYYPSYTTGAAVEEKPEKRPLLRSGRGQKAG